MKIHIKILLIIALALTISSCGEEAKEVVKKEAEEKIELSKTKAEEKEEKKLIIYTSFYPVNEFANRIIGDKMEIRSIISASQEPHGFELSSGELAKISKADLIIFNGANMESFIKDLKDLVNDEDKFLDLSKGLRLLGREKENGEFDHDNVNPHTWLSIKNAMIKLDTIYEKISSIDYENDEYYKSRLEKSLSEFKSLEEKFNKEISELDKKEKYFVVSHAAFNYLAKDYNLKQVAVTGVSPDDEPSAKKLRKIADFVKEKNISTIFFEGKATPKVAETLAKETKTKTSILYTMEALSEKEAELGYLELMKINLSNLLESFK